MQEDQKTSNGEADEKITEELNFNQADYTFIPKGVHQYRQEGYYLVCRGCDLVHAVFIGNERVMVGMDKKGKPILKKRKEIGID